MEEQTSTPPKKNKLRIFFLVGISVVAIVLALLWWINYNKYITTDDAKLDSYRIDIASQVNGRISKLLTHEGDTVYKGQPVFEVESAAMISRRAQAEAQYEECLAQIDVAKTTLNEATLRLWHPQHRLRHRSGADRQRAPATIL